MEEKARWQLVAGAVAVAIVVFLVARSLGGGEPPPSAVRIDGGGARAATGGAGGVATGAGEGRGRVYVHVTGEVRRPGLLRLPDGSRVAAAIARAGGPTSRAQLAAVNLAQRVIDGQQVVVPRVGAVPIAPAPGATAAPGAPEAPETPISLATATQEQLEELDGIGPTLAERIIELRDASGGFRSVDQLQEVEGIGEKRFAALKEAVVP